MLLGWAYTLAAGLVTGAAAEAPPPAPTWETIGARVKWEADHGFTGVVLVARGGKVVFHQAYGEANREKKIPMRTDTILAIGSTPIDFTKAGILLLAERGRLKLTDPITKYFDNVPEDKRAITIEHLMTGRSGLQNFHELPTDRAPDHSWIDRSEAVRRILGQKLLFPPGQGRRHSHSAWGLLAAVIEIAGGQTYPEFTRQHLFKPAGMTDTGFFGERYALDRMAVGYGLKKDGEVNAPPYWGKTSWLVMGSGGQVSTATDMWRWQQAVYGGKLLSPASVRRYGSGQDILAGGDDYGFMILYAGNDQTCMVLMTNTGISPRFSSLGEALAGLVLGRKPPKFTLGVRLEPGDDGRVRITDVLPGGAGERAGLRAGDVLIKIAGKPLGDRPLAVLSAALQTGNPVEIEFERAGRRQKVTVKPSPR